MDAPLLTWARQIAAMPPHPGLLTVTLDIDGARRPRIADCVAAFDSLAHTAKLAARQLGPDATEAVRHDLRRVRAWLNDLDRDDMRGLVVLACGDAGLFTTQLLAHPIADAVWVGDRPRLVEISQAADRAVEHLVVLVDRERLRMLTWVAGGLEQVAATTEPIVRRHDQGGWSAANIQRHADELARRHLERSARNVEVELRRHPGAVLLLGGPADDLAVFETELDETAALRIAARVKVRVDAGDAEIVAAVEETAASLAAVRDAQTVAELAAAAGEDRGVLGIDATLDALFDGRCARVVAVIPPEPAPARPGWRCPRCDMLSASSAECRCGTARVAVEDILDEACAAALRGGTAVSWIAAAAGLEASGGVGALLRY